MLVIWHHIFLFSIRPRKLVLTLIVLCPAAIHKPLKTCPCVSTPLLLYWRLLGLSGLNNDRDLRILFPSSTGSQFTGEVHCRICNNFNPLATFIQQTRFINQNILFMFFSIFLFAFPKFIKNNIIKSNMTTMHFTDNRFAIKNAKCLRKRIGKDSSTS